MFRRLVGSVLPAGRSVTQDFANQHLFPRQPSKSQTKRLAEKLGKTQNSIISPRNNFMESEDRWMKQIASGELLPNERGIYKGQTFQDLPLFGTMYQKTDDNNGDVTPNRRLNSVEFGVHNVNQNGNTIAPDSINTSPTQIGHLHGFENYKKGGRVTKNRSPLPMGVNHIF